MTYAPLPEAGTDLVLTAALVTLPIFAWEAALGVRLTPTGFHQPAAASTS